MSIITILNSRVELGYWTECCIDRQQQNMFSLLPCHSAYTSCWILGAEKYSGKVRPGNELPFSTMIEVTIRLRGVALLLVFRSLFKTLNGRYTRKPKQNSRQCSLKIVLLWTLQKILAGIVGRWSEYWPKLRSKLSDTGGAGLQEFYTMLGIYALKFFFRRYLIFYWKCTV